MTMKKFLCICITLQMFAAMIAIPAMAEENEVFYTDVFEGQATYIIEDAFKGAGSQIPDDKARPSSWDVDYRGGTLSKATDGLMFFDTSETEQVSMERKILPHKEGKITFESTFNFLAEVKKGFKYELRGSDKIAAAFVSDTDALYLLQPNDKRISLGKIVPNKDYGLKATLDFDKKNIVVYLNGKLCGTYKFTDNCTVLEEVFISTSKEETMDVNVKFVNMYINYLVNESFLTTAENAIPETWKLEALDDSNAYVSNVKSESSDDKYSFKIVDSTVIDKAIMKSSFEPQSKKIVGEAKIFFAPQSENVSFAFNSGNKTAVKVYAKRNALYTTNNTLVYEKYLENFWYTVKIIADVESQTADIYLNYKLKLEGVPFETKVSSIDSISIETGVTQKAEVYFDDVLVYKKLDKPADYVPEPAKVESKDHYLAMMMYSMWREGNHYGWDRISPYANRKPYMGYYTEGSPEVADWEIKWLVEHGFDYQVYPWCRQENNLNQPIKLTARIDALNDGFLNAEYSDKMKFALLFSYMYTNTIGGIDDFKEHIVPFWIEYYFKDPRYMVIDNKPIMYIYTWENLKTVFGGKEGIKEVFEYVDQECKKLGFDGIQIVGDNSLRPGDWDEFGAYIYNYGWNHKASSLGTMKKSLGAQFDGGRYDVVASIPMGWDNEPWITGTTGSFAEPETTKQLSQFVKDKFEQMEAEGRKATRNVIYTCWNEYGEGHFYCPSTAHGFDYLNAVREVFTDAGVNENEAVPTARALARLQVLYPPNRSALKMLNDPPKMPDEDDVYVVKGWYFDKPEDFAQWSIYKEIEYIKQENGTLVGHANNNDPRIANENIEIDLTNVVGIRSNCWVDGGGSAMFIYRTDSDPVYGKGKRFDVVLNSDEYKDYFAPPLDKSKLKGKMTGLFFDPDDYLFLNFGDFGVKYIEILAAKDPMPSYYLNGSLINDICEPKRVDGTVFVSGYRTFENQGARTQWDNATQTFTIEKNNKTLVFENGNSKVLLNGKPVDIGVKAFYDDGHFFVPLHYVCNELGIEVSTEKPVKPERVQHDEFTWEFDEDGNLDGWKTANIGFKRVENNEIMIKGLNKDPILNSPELNLDAAKYKYVKVRMKNLTGKSRAQVFFITTEDTTWGKGKNVDAVVTETKEYTEYTFDMSSNSKWAGNIKQIRFDPVELPGTVYVDYIKILQDK